MVTVSIVFRPVWGAHGRTDLTVGGQKAKRERKGLRSKYTLEGYALWT
jgi:hypothetical protein